MSRAKVPNFSDAIDFSAAGEYAVMVPSELLQRSSKYRGGPSRTDSSSARDGQANEECFFNVRYSFHPDSMNPQKPISLSKEKDEYILETETVSSADPPLHVFSGKATTAKDLECVLIYNDSSGQFELRPLSTTLRVQPDKQRQQKIITSREGENNKNIQTPPAMDLTVSGPNTDTMPVGSSTSTSPSVLSAVPKNRRYETSATPQTLLPRTQLSSKSLPKTVTAPTLPPTSTASSEVYHDEDEVDFDDELAGQLEQELLDDIDFDFDDEDPPTPASGSAQIAQASNYSPTNIPTTSNAYSARPTSKTEIRSQREPSPIVEIIENAPLRRPEPPKPLTRGLTALASTAKPISLRNLAGNSRYDEDELSSSEEE
ncbi:hypothetical protein NADFUDRAFT_45817 [Nadsonia fulvescens var. elongata DSM 6958]|uniref:Transcription elongation factor Eaf N-terminal domain-containing protein n=1 Tax=Nadsonia fulvescens var. elongata DSM 6958 TaxID=857566 RepID=A0A1E3PN88_9ASCO|nr:hypothetical protein NADFUDRAFT_45817 [Nadsonia fulvescens var. elongata DSM 6958]